MSAKGEHINKVLRFSLALALYLDFLPIKQHHSTQFRSGKLTAIAVLASPAWPALAEVSTNQVAAGPGVDAGAVSTLVCI